MKRGGQQAHPDSRGKVTAAGEVNTGKKKKAKHEHTVCSHVIFYTLVEFFFYYVLSVCVCVCVHALTLLLCAVETPAPVLQRLEVQRLRSSIEDSHRKQPHVPSYQQINCVDSIIR